jgi:cytosine deaminase
MSGASMATGVIENVLLPRSLLRAPDRFGGRERQDCLWGDLVIREGRAVGLEAPSGEEAPRGMVLPPLCEPHVHLDKCHTIGRIGRTGSTLLEAIESQRRDKAHWTAEDLRRRASRGLAELVEAGVRRVRSHVDWPDGASALTPPPAWHVLSELAEEWRPRIDLHLSPLIGVGDQANPDLSRLMGRLLSDKGHALGCFVHSQPVRREGIRAAVETAHRHDLALDFHVDEGLEVGLDGLSLIAEAVLEVGYAGPILCGHACSLMNLPEARLAPLLDRIARAGITVAALPSTNLYLQGRGAGTPDRRGITRVQELRAAGIPVVLGTDNVGDAFCPLNRHDPRFTLMLAALGVHLDPPYGDHLPMITTEANRAIGAPPGHIEDLPAGDLLFLPARNSAELVADLTPPRPLGEIVKEEAT